MSASAVTEKTWVAFGPVGAVGTIKRSEDGYAVRLLDDPANRGIYPSLDVAKSALYAALLPGSEWPEFRER
jgi:hypothetical protein